QDRQGRLQLLLRRAGQGAADGVQDGGELGPDAVRVTAGEGEVTAGSLASGGGETPGEGVAFRTRRPPGGYNPPPPTNLPLAPPAPPAGGPLLPGRAPPPRPRRRRPRRPGGPRGVFVAGVAGAAQQRVVIKIPQQRPPAASAILGVVAHTLQRLAVLLFLLAV